MKIRKMVILFLIFSFILSWPGLVFGRNYLISNQELEDYSAMDVEGIRNFLLKNNSFLAYYADFYPEDGLFMEAAEIIWRTAQKFKINPQVILTILEKEQSLISYQKPSQKRLDWAMGFGVCDKCRLAHPLVAKYKSFANQVYYAAARIRNIYLADLEKYGKTHTGFAPGKTSRLDRRYLVTPANNATAILYTYTPHLRGNETFYKLWNRWFSDIIYPDGSLLQDKKSGGVYLIADGKKRPFLSRGAFISRYSENQLIPVDISVLSRYADGEPIKFPDYSLLRDPSAKIYLTVGDQIKPFESYEVFKSIGFNPFEIEDVAERDLAGYSLGETITLRDSYPSGALLQHKTSGGVYWVYNGKKYPIPDRSILKARFDNRRITKADDQELNKFEKGEPIKFENGTLIKSETGKTVYFISQNKLRPIFSEEIFLAYGWRWENIIATTDKVLSLYEFGPPITLGETRGLTPPIPSPEIQNITNAAEDMRIIF